MKSVDFLYIAVCVATVNIIGYFSVYLSKRFISLNVKASVAVGAFVGGLPAAIMYKEFMGYGIGWYLTGGFIIWMIMGGYMGYMAWKKHYEAIGRKTESGKQERNGVSH